MAQVENFSLWVDFLERGFIDSTFETYLQESYINGATSNPAIFAQALASQSYENAIEELKELDAKRRYETLAIEDIQAAAKALMPKYTQGNYGFVSIEIDPFLCDDAAASIEEGKRLYRSIGYENVMIKVPATAAGYEVMQALIAEGIHVNATLVFLPEQVKGCLSAFSKGYLQQTSTKVKAVISIFVSRYDRVVDELLIGSGITKMLTGIYNASVLYAMIEQSHLDFVTTLFASTSVKNNEVDAAYYVKALMASASINTAPLATIDAFLAAPSFKAKLPIDSAKVSRHFELLRTKGIDLDEVGKKLLDDAIVQFKEAFSTILKTI